jgi:hypothetical protein
VTLDATQLFSVSGGKPPYSYSTPPNLPNNLVFSEGGFLSGTINATGNFTVLTTIRDSLGNTRSANCTIPIYPKLVIGTPSPLPVAYIGSNYSTTINATGGKPCYTWTLNSTLVDPEDFGNLQIGNLTCNSSTTTLSGIPKKVGNYTMTVNATDSCGQSANQTYAIEVKENAILACLKEIWVVVDCGGTYSHGCSKAFYSILANGVKIMDASLDNAGGVNDYASISLPPATFIKTHPDFPGDSTARYNRVLIDGTLLNSVAQSGADGIVTIEAICNYGFCHSGGVGRLRVYTSKNETNNDFSKVTKLYDSIEHDVDDC